MPGKYQKFIEEAEREIAAKTKAARQLPEL
jgi:hypothetical protein